jgi:hypothetical protein
MLRRGNLEPIFASKMRPKKRIDIGGLLLIMADGINHRLSVNLT